MFVYYGAWEPHSWPLKHFLKLPQGTRMDYMVCKQGPRRAGIENFLFPGRPAWHLWPFENKYKQNKINTDFLHTS